VGKSTILRATREILRSRGHEVEDGAFPGNAPGTLGKLVYDLHHNPRQFGIAHLASSSLQMMHVAAHLDAIEGWITPARENGRMILLDRFWWSTAAYAEVAELADTIIERILAPELLYWQQQPPDAVFLLSRDQRSRGNPSDHGNTALSAAYTRIANDESHRTRVIQIVNQDTVERVAANVADHIGSICGS
jgi:thymidylate kinase